jgi:hypothetical protein
MPAPKPPFNPKQKQCSLRRSREEADKQKKGGIGTDKPNCIESFLRSCHSVGGKSDTFSGLGIPYSRTVITLFLFLLGDGDCNEDESCLF